MEEPKKKQEHEGLTRECRTEKGRSEKKQTLERKLNKEKILLGSKDLGFMFLES